MGQPAAPVWPVQAWVQILAPPLMPATQSCPLTLQSLSTRQGVPMTVARVQPSPQAAVTSAMASETPRIIVPWYRTRGVLTMSRRGRVIDVGGKSCASRSQRSSQSPSSSAPSANGDYPPGPYGYGQGTIMANLNFVGKQSPMNVDYTTLPMQPIDMATVRQNAKLILIDGAARWCTPCNRDQPNMRQIEQDYASKGVVTMEVLVEGGYG